MTHKSPCHEAVLHLHGPISYRPPPGLDSQIGQTHSGYWDFTLAISSAWGSLSQIFALSIIIFARSFPKHFPTPIPTPITPVYSASPP